MHRIVTLKEFIYTQQSGFPGATGDLSRLLSDISTASKIVNNAVSKAGLIDILGKQGEINVQGEEQQKLDVIADNIFIKAFQTSGDICGVGSEENEEHLVFDTPEGRDGKYVVMIDPLDGSSNIDVNVSIGTIFSIFKRVSPQGTKAVKEDFLQKGSAQVAAGYVIYGSSTMLVYTTGNGVNGFTLDPHIGEYCLSHPSMKMPDDGGVYAINEANYHNMPKGVQAYCDYCKEVNEGDNRKYTARYIGSLVADFHRNMIKGGIYIYSVTRQSPRGKLRLLYECSPIAFIAEQAGGFATDGFNRIMDVEVHELHQRIGFFVGSKVMMDKAHELMLEFKEEPSKI